MFFVSAKQWTPDNTNTLVQAYSHYWAKGNGVVKWRKCYQLLQKLGLERRQKHCLDKVKNLRRGFLSIIRSSNDKKIEHMSNSCEYWDRMVEMWAKDA